MKPEIVLAEFVRCTLQMSVLYRKRYLNHLTKGQLHSLTLIF